MRGPRHDAGNGGFPLGELEFSALSLMGLLLKSEPSLAMGLMIAWGP
jgi:hypothetical protein